MKTQFILTFNNNRQEFITLDVLPLRTKKEMITFCIGLGIGVNPDNKLVKVSMCVDIGKEKLVKLPDWYENCNGKLWENDLNL